MQKSEREIEKLSLRRALEAGDRKALRSQLNKMHHADIALFIESIPPEQRAEVWSTSPLRKRAAALAELSDDVRNSMIQSLAPNQLVQTAALLERDDLADLAPELAPDILARVLKRLPVEERKEIDTLLSLPVDSAGGLMNLDTVTVRPGIRIATLLRYLRLLKTLPEYTDKIFVTEKNGTLIGCIPLANIVTHANQQDSIDVITDKKPRSFDVHDDERTVAEAFQRYNLTSAAVVDPKHTLIGRITIDDVVDVIAESHTLGQESQVGDDLFAPVLSSSGNRTVWLGINMLTALLASWVITNFEQTLEKLVALAVILPIIASMGGNAGTQTMILTIRGITSETVSWQNALRLLRNEFLIGSVNAMIWSCFIAMISYLWYQNATLGLVAAAAMIVNLLFAAGAGVMIPLVFEKIGIDPALASGVVLTTVTDVVGFFAVLGIATVILL